MLDDIGQDGFLLVRPIIRASTEFYFYDRADITDGTGWEDRWVMEE